MLRKQIVNILEILALITAVVTLVLYPAQSIDAAREGLEMCANVIVPSLFPFFVLSTMIVETGAARYFGRFMEPVMRTLFGVNGTCSSAFALGFIGGYPVGAKTVISLYENGSCTKTEAERLLSFCNNSGPAFIFGFVGAGVFSNGIIGLLLYLAHTMASVLVGVMFRFYGHSEKNARRKLRGEAPKRLVTAFSGAVKSSVISMLNICGFVIFFMVFIKMLVISGALPAASHALSALFAPFGLNAGWAERFLTGIIEMTSGVWTLKDAGGSLTASVAMAAFMLGWAGLSVHSQVLSFIGSSGLSVKTYIAGKFLQGVISAGIIAVIGRVLALQAPAAAVMAYQAAQFSRMPFWKALIISLGSAALIFAVLFIVVWRTFRRSGADISCLPPPCDNPYVYPYDG